MRYRAVRFYFESFFLFFSGFLSAFFGATVATDAYYLSFSIPDLFLQLTLAGGLTSAIVPLLSAEEREPAFGGPPAVARSLLEGYTVLAAAAAALGVIIMPWLIARLAPGFDTPTQRLATNLGRVMILSLPFLTAAAVATGYLNFRRSFAIPALRPAVQSLAVIGGVILLYRRFGVYSAAGGVTVGAIGWGPRLGVADAPRRRNTPGPEAS